MTARRSLLTATAAGSVLFALWFVPSANAIVGTDGATDSGLRAASAQAGRAATDEPDRAGRTGSGAKGTGPTAPHHLLADTGSPDTTPYAIGGAAFLVLGAGLVGYSVRRSPGGTA
ncbi:hypothetical protein ACWD6P_11725 [Streptomyces sp. NPDC002446]